MINTSKLQEVAQAMVTKGKGILAADESTGTIGKRFDKIGLENTEENRRAWRDTLFSTKGLEQYISGVILYEETIRQGVLNNPDIIPGIKVDEGVKPMADSPLEKILKPMPELSNRLAQYASMGARFAKSRNVLTIGDGLPSEENLLQNAQAEAQYALICQEAGIVPIVEPEVLMDGSHSMAQCEEATTRTLMVFFKALVDAGVKLEGIVLKPNMIVPGNESGETATPEQIAESTVRVLTKTVPKEVPGIAFLSGGQSEQEATANLNAMNLMGDHPWNLTFSYGRALQESALKAWAGKEDNIVSTQKALLHRAKMNSLATLGKYSKDLEI